ncbi:hypothetical protein BD310DRAFT_954437 [Dichomitus squalens]|uniref:Uncharacterized protein n=1 Tax=Dichomitus squalens TaxID=114155 RepID=A0A4Q9QCW7_9APHY|nr:hypothetical protein BD310DRAFT_954437 [Dichomitus squalens]
MFKVLVHPHGALSPGLFSPISLLYLPFQLLSRPLLLSFILGLLAATIPAVTAQGFVNAQALTVIDSPAPNSPLHAGSTQGIALDVSAGSSGPFAYNFLEVYLVSATTGTNITVSNTPQLLTQEPGSTVKHINWLVEPCLQSGPYNLTVYESSTLTSDGTGYFTILAVPVQVDNGGVPDPSSCASELNTLQAQPQASSPPPVNLIPGRGNPSGSSTLSSVTATGSATGTATSNVTGSATAISNVTGTATATPTPSAGEIITITAGNGDITIPISNLPGTIVVEPSGGAPPETSTSDVSSGFTTIFKTVAPTTTATLTVTISQPLTVTFEQTFVSTFTASGQTQELTVTQTQTLVSTVELIQTQVQTQVSSPEQAGLLPVNSGSGGMSPLSAVTLLSAASVSAFVYVLCSSFTL